MKPITWIGIVLVILGVLSLAYQGINYNRQESIVDVGPVHLTAETHERISLPPIVGGLALASGAIVLMMGTRAKT